MADKEILQKLKEQYFFLEIEEEEWEHFYELAKKTKNLEKALVALIEDVAKRRMNLTTILFYIPVQSCPKSTLNCWA